MLLDRPLSVTLYLDMVTDRRYAAVWSKLEQKAGANLADASELYLANAEARLADKPGDKDRFADLVRAFHYHGDFAGVIERAGGIGGGIGSNTIEEDDGWALNLTAYAHDSLGRIEQGDAIFDRLTKVDGQENNWAVSFLINRASRLIGYGRFEEGLEAATLARSVKGSPYAEMIVAKDHACALYGLGRADEAAPELAFLRENKAASVEMAAQGLLCHGLRDEAVTLLSEAFGRRSDARLGDIGAAIAFSGPVLQPVDPALSP